MEAAELLSAGRTLVCVENSPDAVPLHLAELPSSGAYVFGNEAEGVSQGVLEMSHMKLTIPQTGGRRCINVSSTAAMVAWEIQRRRLKGE